MADDFDPYYQWLGIPSKHQPPNHYRLLAIEEFESNLDVIENAADQRMQHVRSFQNGPQGAASQRLLNEITSAKLCLLNLAKKAEYDQKLRAEKDAAEPRRLKPLPRLAQTAPPTEAYRIASGVPAPVASKGQVSPARRLASHEKTMIGIALGVLLVAVILFLALSSLDWNTALNHHNDSLPSDSDIRKTTVESQATERTHPPTNGGSNAEPTTLKTPDIPAASTPQPESVFLDDLNETDSKIRYGTLGKHGSGGHPDLPNAIFRGTKVSHALVTVPTSRDMAHVAYALNGEFKTFRATAGLLEVPQETKAGCGLIFKVYGDGRLLWQSTPIQRLGTGQSVLVDIQSVRTLKLEVQCPGAYDFAWAAWINPVVSKRPAVGRMPTQAPPGSGVTSLANSKVRFTVPAEHYAVLRGGDVEAVIVDNSAVDDTVLKGHRAGYNGVASLTHAARPGNLFVPAVGGLHFAFIHDGANRVAIAEPRLSPLELRVVSDRVVELYQKPTPNWALETAIRYELLDDGVIEMTVECIPHQKTFANGFIGLHFPSYVERAESPEICFLGRDPSDARAAGSGNATRWLNSLAPAGEFVTVHASDDQRDFPQDPAAFDAPVHRSPLRYDAPWFYGVSHGMAYVQMFRSQDQVRFARYPVGGGAGNPEWSFGWFIPDCEVGKLYRLVMRAMYVPLESLRVGLVEPHLRQLNAGAPSAQSAAPTIAYLDDLPEVDFKVGHGRLEKHGLRGLATPNELVLFQGRTHVHSLFTHAADGQMAYVVYDLDRRFRSFRALAALLDLNPGYSVRTPARFTVLCDGKEVWASLWLHRAGAGDMCSLDVQGVKLLRLEVHTMGDPSAQHAAWLNPLVSTASEPPAPPQVPHTSLWNTEGDTQFALSETHRGLLLQMVPGTSKLYSKIEITLRKTGDFWGGTGELYFMTTPDKPYEAKIEITSGDVLSSPTIRVRTICPVANMRKKLTDSTATWTRKEP